MTGPSHPSHADEIAALRSLLIWYGAMGVDAAIDDIPHNRFVEAPARRPETPTTPRPSPPAVAAAAPQRRHLLDAAPSSAEDLVRNAETLAAASEDLESLRANWRALPGCGLAATAAQMIFAGGTPGAPLMLIGGAPYSDDERQGRIFAGPEGRLLDGMLRAIGLDRDTVYLANVIPWRPPGNRPPSPLELSLCLPFVRRHIALAKPSLILCLGERAAQPLLRTGEPISRLRGRRLAYEGDATTTKTLVTYALDFLLKQPLQKRRAWEDVLALRAELDAATA